MTSVSGRCLCGKIRYRISQEPISKGICYCHQCQKAGGALGSPLLVLAERAFECSGDSLSAFETKSDRGSTVSRNFCQDCGCHIFARISDIPELITVRANTLDDVDLFRPDYLVWTQSAGSSCMFPSGVPAFSASAPLAVLLGARVQLRRTDLTDEMES